MPNNTPRHSLTVRVTHWLTFIAFAALLVTGIEIIISHPHFYWGETGNVNMQPLINLHIPSSRDSIPNGYNYELPDGNGWGRYLHFEAAWLLVFTALIYGIVSLWKGHFRRNLIPERGQRNLKALWQVVAKYLRRAPADPQEQFTYNALQRVTYLCVIFVLFPGIIWTGLAMSPSFSAAFPFFVNILGGKQSARTLHFFDTILLSAFFLTHIAMVAVTGFKARMRAITLGDPYKPQPGLATDSSPINTGRRKLIYTGIALTAGFAGVAVATRLAGRFGLIPPDGGGIFGPGETLTYACQRLITNHSLAREFPRSMISAKPFANPVAPPNEAYKKLQAEGFKNWRLTIDGLVERPMAFSLDELKAMPQSSHITETTCEEGWSYVAEWIGTPLHNVLDQAGVKPEARYVVYFSIEPEWWESIDMAEAAHPQTILSYGMNGGELPRSFGGPLRLRVPRQLGYKNVKYITHITVTDEIKKFGKGLGSAAPEGGYSWYAGI
jgi:DMSO/TMAO reductase YedYZ molybdopterin-dependent catalytic subunit/thiosulfate reductase cytochrome b subunit